MKNRGLILNHHISFNSLSILLLLSLSHEISAQTSALDIRVMSTSLFKVDSNGDLFIEGNIINGFAEMYIYDNAIDLVSAQNVYKPIEQFTAGNLAGWTFAANSLTASTGSAGLYLVFYSISFEGDINDNHDIAISKNGIIQQNLNVQRKVGGSGDCGVAGGVGYVQISDGDIIRLEIRNIDAPADPTIRYANVTLKRQ